MVRRMLLCYNLSIMKHFNYYNYENKINIDKLRKTSGAKTLKICLDLMNTGLKFLLASIKSENSNLRPKARQELVRKMLWSR